MTKVPFFAAEPVLFRALNRNSLFLARFHNPTFSFYGKTLKEAYDQAISFRDTESEKVHGKRGLAQKRAAYAQAQAQKSEQVDNDN